jgi:hypothetical protein
MKKTIILTLAALLSAGASASTDHYLRRDGAHVQHLKITRTGNETMVSMDVDFEPTSAEAGQGIKPCSVEIDGDARPLSENELVLKKQYTGEPHYCTLKIHLTDDAATVEQSDDCSYFLGNFCKFGSEGKSLEKIK